mmetsp:Transcript_32267/g.44298  ORF Transcript_32267/g.44298 Transcript_32267/m.44298 type:complete len:120 (+) Transcript_32267:40-399(+)
MHIFHVLECVSVTLGSIPLAFIILLVLPQWMNEARNLLCSSFFQSPWYMEIVHSFQMATRAKLDITAVNVLILACIITMSTWLSLLEDSLLMQKYLLQRGWRVQRWKESKQRKFTSTSE